jgi:hypothetical protein
MNFNKNKLTAISIFAALIIVSLITAIPATKATTFTMAAQLAVNPDPVGVNQPITIVVWVAPLAPNVGDLHTGYTVTITDPDGIITTLGPKTAWPHGAAAWGYTPTKVGDYSFKFNYAGDTFGPDTFLPAESPVTILTVQEDPTPDWPAAPLPADYWEGVVNTENREWYQISGSWLDTYYDSTYVGFGDATAGYNPFSTAPRTPHIMWTKPATTGGLSGGELGSLGEYSGLSYGVHLSPPIIMNGRLYYNRDGSRWGHFQRSRGYPGFVAVDLRTGEELWQVEGTGIDAGQHFRYDAPNGQGVRSFLWDRSGPVWNVFDPFNGDLLFSFENATSGTNWWWEDAIVRGENGEMYIYILDGYGGFLAMWNSTKAFQENGIISIASDGTAGFNIRPGTHDWNTGIEWSVTIPDRNVAWHTPYSIFGVSDGVALAKSGDGSNTVDWDIGYSIDTGAELWATPMGENTQGWFTATGEGVYATWNIPQRRWEGYSITTGAKLWDADQMDYPWGTYVSYSPIITHGKLLSGGWDGYLHAYDLADGSEVWRFHTGDSGSEHVSGGWPVWYGPIVADGVAFIGTGEETPTQPLTRGNRVFAVDIETGEEIWNIAGYMSLRAVAEGYLMGYNGYDSQIYCFGKGPSATTVTAPKTEIIQGQTIVIEGTVTDQSAGAMGTPAISDDDMGAWMEYLYMQKPFPGSATGVDVSIDVIDANGNFRNIGTATSDVSGVFALAWEPDISGIYTVIATFAGSESYGSSFAQTNFYVEEAPAPTPPPDPTPAPQTDTYVLGTGIAILAAVIILGLLILRKK